RAPPERRRTASDRSADPCERVHAAHQVIAAATPRSRAPSSRGSDGYQRRTGPAPPQYTVPQPLRRCRGMMLPDLDVLALRLRASLRASVRAAQAEWPRSELPGPLLQVDDRTPRGGLGHDT